MSRGPGRVQRAIVELFATEPAAMLDSITIACRVFGVEACEPAQAVSVRRALHSLAERGELVDLGRRGWRGGSRRWARPEKATEYQERVERTFGRG